MAVVNRFPRQPTFVMMRCPRCGRISAELVADPQGPVMERIGSRCELEEESPPPSPGPRAHPKAPPTPQRG
jgi:hypothetical protein